MQLGFHSATTMTSDLETDIRAAAAAGFTGLELWAGKVRTYLQDCSLAELRALLAEHQVKPQAINSIEFIAFRGPEYEGIRAQCRELSEVAQAIGCPTVVVVPSPTPRRDISWEEVVAEYVAVLRDLADIAAGYGVQLAFELLGFGWCSVRTPRAAAEIVRAVDRPNVGLVIDAAHFYGGGGALEELSRLDPQRIFAFHLDDVEDVPKEAITDARRLLPGLGVIPLDAICSQLSRIGFDGPCSVELFRPEYWAWDPVVVATRAREAATGILSPHFSLA